MEALIYIFDKWCGLIFKQLSFTPSSKILIKNLSNCEKYSKTIHFNWSKYLCKNTNTSTHLFVVSYQKVSLNKATRTQVFSYFTTFENISNDNLYTVISSKYSKQKVYTEVDLFQLVIKTIQNKVILMFINNNENLNLF